MAIVEEVREKQHIPVASDTSREASLPRELAYLTTAFAPGQEASSRSKAYLVLASYCQGLRASHPPKDGDEIDPGTQQLVRIFTSAIESIADPQEEDILASLSFLSALFQVDWQAASSLFCQETTLAAIVDVVDLFTTDSISKEVARLLSQASGHKSCRSAIPKDCIQWLVDIIKRSKDQSIRALGAMAIVKLTRGAKSDTSDLPQPNATTELSGTDGELLSLMKGLIISGDKDALSDAVEGLAYLSAEPSVKEMLIGDKEFLTAIFSLAAPRRGSTTSAPSHTFLYGITVIIMNLSAYRPRLSAEDAQLQKLRRLAKAGSKPPDVAVEGPADALDDDNYARERGRIVVGCGGLHALTSAVRLADSEGMRLAAGQAFLSLAEDKENRRLMLQCGGGRALMDIIRKALPSATQSNYEPSETASISLIPIQALAKLAITASPTQVFGPDSGAIYDSIRPLSTLLLHQSSTLLQLFEAMMALTNVASHSAEVADRIAKSKALVSKIEFLMLEDHTLIRRAATELICNLMAGSEAIFNRYASDGNSDSAKSRLHILLALSDVSDLPTQLAASGALATLTSSPHACKLLYALQEERGRVLPTFIQLVDPSPLDEQGNNGHESSTQALPSPDAGLVHRGVVCIRNFLTNLDMDVVKALIRTGEGTVLLRALKRTLQLNRENISILQPAAESLKRLLDGGMGISG